MASSLIEELRPQKFNPAKSFWDDDVDVRASSTATNLTFVTYNVWFGNYYFKERCEALLKIVHDCDADAIALQEVTPSFLEIVLNQKWIQNSYYISDATGETIEGYGVILLSRIPIRRLLLYKLPSSMSRKLLVAELCVNEEIFNVATVHLESMKSSARLRAEQLSAIFPLLFNSEHSVLMGDFNFCSSWKRENASLDSKYQDLWAVLRNNELGYTENTDINLMRLKIKQKEKKVRFDRILLRSSPQSWQPQSIQLLGTEPISKEHPDIFPSDHFGLVGNITWNPMNTKDSEWIT